MKRKHQRLAAYAGGIALVVGGGALAKFVDPTAGAALVAAGAFVIGGIQKEMLPRPHRRSTDGGTIVMGYSDGHKTPRATPTPTPVTK